MRTNSCLWQTNLRWTSTDPKRDPAVGTRPSVLRLWWDIISDSNCVAWGLEVNWSLVLIRCTPLSSVFLDGLSVTWFTWSPFMVPGIDYSHNLSVWSSNLEESSSILINRRQPHEFLDQHWSIVLTTIRFSVVTVLVYYFHHKNKQNKEAKQRWTQQIIHTWAKQIRRISTNDWTHVTRSQRINCGNRECTRRHADTQVESMRYGKHSSQWKMQSVTSSSSL